MLNYKKLLLIAFATFIKFSSIAQTASGTETNINDGFMRSEGKIYVVMIVVITILAGLILYLFRLESKINKFEKGKNL